MKSFKTTQFFGTKSTTKYFEDKIHTPLKAFTDGMMKTESEG